MNLGRLAHLSLASAIAVNRLVAVRRCVKPVDMVNTGLYYLSVQLLAVSIQIFQLKRSQLSGFAESLLYYL